MSDRFSNIGSITAATLLSLSVVMNTINSNNQRVDMRNDIATLRENLLQSAFDTAKVPAELQPAIRDVLVNKGGDCAALEGSKAEEACKDVREAAHFEYTDNGTIRYARHGASAGEKPEQALSDYALA